MVARATHTHFTSIAQPRLCAKVVPCNQRSNGEIVSVGALKERRRGRAGPGVEGAEGALHRLIPPHPQTPGGKDLGSSTVSSPARSVPHGRPQLHAGVPSVPYP